MSNMITKNIIDKIYEKYKKKVDYKEFNDSFSRYVDSVNIDNKTYYIARPLEFDNPRFYSLCDENGDIIFTNLAHISYKENFKWFRLLKQESAQSFLSNYYSVETEQLVSDEWYIYDDKQTCKLDFNEDSMEIEFIQVRTDNGFNMLLKDGTYYLKEWLNYDKVFFNDGFIDVRGKKYGDENTLNKSNALNYNLETLLPMWFDCSYGFNEKNSPYVVVELDGKSNVFNCKTQEYLFQNWYELIDKNHPEIDKSIQLNKLWLVKLNGKYNYIDNNENPILPEWYDKCFFDGTPFGFVYQKDKGYMLVNLDGEYLLDKFYFGLFEIIQDDIKNRKFFEHFIFFNNEEVPSLLGIHNNTSHEYVFVHGWNTEIYEKLEQLKNKEEFDIEHKIIEINLNNDEND